MPKETVLGLCREQGINYTVTDGYSWPGKTGSGIPYVVVFDHTGKAVYSGRTDGMDKAVEDAIAKAPDWLLGVNDYKILTGEASSILRRRNMGETLATLRAKAQGGEEVSAEEQAEAERMLARLLPYAEKQLAKAEAMKTTDPSAAFELYKKLSKQFDGDEIGAKADATYEELKDSDAFQDSLKADKYLKAALELQAEFESCGYNKPLKLDSCEECREENAKLLKKAGGYLAGIIKKYPDTPAAKEAERLMRAWGLK